MIPRTNPLHAALRDVRKHEVVFYSGFTAHVQGYAWRQGGDMAEGEQQALRELAAVHLIAQIAACVHRDEIGAEVVLTKSGTDQLSMWDHAVARAGRHRAVAQQDWCDTHRMQASGCIYCADPAAWAALQAESRNAFEEGGVSA